MEGTLEHRLLSLRRRVRSLAFLYGAGRVVSLSIAAALVVVAADYLLNLPAIPRLVLATAAAVLAISAIWLYLIRPLLSRLSLSDIAGRVEQAFPEFEDRLRSGVMFRTLSAADIESHAMRGRVREQAEAIAARVDIRRAVDGRPAWRMSALALLILALTTGLALLTPSDYRAAAWSRLTHPFSHYHWPKRTQIAVVGDLPTRIAAGDRIAVRVKLTKGDKPSARATVYYQYNSGPNAGAIRSELMTRTPDGQYAASLDARVEGDSSATAAGGGAGGSAADMKIWVKSGDDEKQLSAVTVVPRLAVRKVFAEVVPPDYAKSATAAAPNTYDLALGPIGVVEGSTIRLKLDFNKELASPPELTILGPQDTTPKVSATNAGTTATAQFLPEKTIRFTLHATDLDGFTTSSLTEYEVAVRPDQAPAIQIDLPRRSESRTATALVPLQATAEDDFALRDVQLHVRRLTATPAPGNDWTLPLVTAATPEKGADWQEANSAPDRTRMRLRYLWELSALSADLKPGDVLEFFLSATDNYRRQTPAGVLTHPPATSSRLRITIVSQDELAAKATEELRAAADQIAQLKLAQQRTSTETQELTDQSKNRDKLDDAQKSQAKRLAEQQSVLASQSKQIAAKVSDLMDRLAENRMESRELPATARDVRDVLDRAAEGPMKEASTQTNAARDANQPKRDENFSQARENQKESEKLLSQALDRLATLGSLRQTMDNLKRVLGEQQDVGKQTRDLARNNLGKTPEEMSPADRKKLAELTDKQKDLAKQVEKMQADMEKQSEEMKASDPQSSQALKQAAETGKQQQVSPSQSRAAAAMQQNQQTQAQSEQRRAEVGLQVMLDQLREAERRKLEELTRKLADLQEQLQVLVRRQAGHNLDNLGLSNALAKFDPKELTKLLDLSQRPKEKPATADAPTLSTGQEQTERNTRSLSDAASTVQGAADVAGVLSRAASRMERAAVLIRGSDLPGAYEPSQREALSLLIEAEQAVDAMRRKAENEKQEQERDTIRALYQAIRDEQDTVLKETRRLDAIQTRLGPNAELPRVEAQKLLALPNTQSALADRTARIEEALVQMGSIVYVWANKDIVQSMNESNAGLAKRTTDAAVQSHQQSAVEQLDAMIASLTIKPPEKEFEQGGGGGGSGGGGKQKLPSEVELRLLKALQTRVNKSTKDQAPAPDKAQVSQLAKRQADLRRLTGELLEKASNGDFKPGPEPKRDNKLPEEQDAGAEDKSLDQELLGDGKAHGESANPHSANVVDRMGRVRQRLGDDIDPGAITQKIEAAILKDIDDLIEEARKQQQQGSSSSKSKGQPGGQPGQPKPGGEQANNGQGKGPNSGSPSGASTGATVEAGGPGAIRQPGKGGDIRESASEWGSLAPRQRQAIMDGQSDAIIEKYRALIDDYYRSLAEKSK